VGQRSCAGRAN